jgi:hypothetical protein
MGIEKEQVLEILNGEADAEAKAITLIDAFTKSFDEEKTKILLNKEDIKNEKKAEIEKRKAAEAENTALKEQVKTLQEQLTVNSPDEVKKFYESKLADQTKVFDGKLADLNKTLELSQQENESLKKVQHRMTCMEQFNKAITGKNISPDCVNDFSMYVLGPDCCKFAERSLGEAGSAILTNEGQTIESAVQAALETSFGKACVMFKNSGGGAEGGTRGSSNGDKTISRSEFDAMSPYDRSKLMADGFRIV